MPMPPASARCCPRRGRRYRSSRSWRGEAHPLDASFPQLRFTLPPLPRAFSSSGAGCARAQLLIGQAENFVGAGFDSQAVVLQKPPADAAANGTGSGQCFVCGEIQLGGVVEDQDGIARFSIRERVKAK